MKNIKKFEEFNFKKVLSGVKDFGKTMFSGDYGEFDTEGTETETVYLSDVVSVLSKAISSGEIDMISINLEELVKRIEQLTPKSSGFGDTGAE